MIRVVAALAIALASAPSGAETTGQMTVTAAARQIFERDWVLMNWALKFHDRNHDILIDAAEAAAAADAFRQLADVDGDGRITPGEYRAARAFILARH